MRTSVTPDGVVDGRQTRAAGRGARWRRMGAASTPARSSRGPEPNFDFAGSGWSPTFSRKANPLRAASLLEVLMLQPISPPLAGGCALFCQTVSAVVPGACADAQLDPGQDFRHPGHMIY